MPYADSKWREATAEETADYLADRVSYSETTSEPLEIRETSEGLEVLEGTPLECGCVPHSTYMRGMWGFYCETEGQPYCNFECPHEDDDEDGCEGHESLAGEHMGETVYCDGSCKS